MAYESLLAQGIIRPHGLNADEVKQRCLEMSAVMQRHLADAQTADLSIDGQYCNTYTVARIASEIVMLVEGYRSGHTYGAHAAVFAFLAAFPHEGWELQAKLFDEARKKRNTLEYERTGIVTETELDELRAQVKHFLWGVRLWLQADHRDLGLT